MSVSLLAPAEIKAARFALGLSLRGMAEIVGLSSSNGADRLLDYEEGRLPISGPVSQCIRLWLAVNGLGPAPLMPTDRPRAGLKNPG
jgi:DNA-binding transcriptional regulator YiaG